MALIPGTVGACPIQNIGAYGTEVREFIETVEAYHRGTQQLKRISNADCEFGYRDSMGRLGLRRRKVEQINVCPHCGLALDAPQAEVRVP